MVTEVTGPVVVTGGLAVGVVVGFSGPGGGGTPVPGGFGDGDDVGRCSHPALQLVIVVVEVVKVVTTRVDVPSVIVDVTGQVVTVVNVVMVTVPGGDGELVFVIEGVGDGCFEDEEGLGLGCVGVGEVLELGYVGVEDLHPPLQLVTVAVEVVKVVTMLIDEPLVIVEVTGQVVVVV